MRFLVSDHVDMCVCVCLRGPLSIEVSAIWFDFHIYSRGDFSHNVKAPRPSFLFFLVGVASQLAKRNPNGTQFSLFSHLQVFLIGVFG